MTRRPSAFDLVITVVGVLLMIPTGLNMPEVVRAARSGMGVHGTFTAQTQSCISHPGHTACNLRGRFRSDDGTIDSAGVVLYGDGAGLRTGERARARDIGRTGRVYLMAGSREWIVSALLIAAGLLLIRRGRVHRPILAALSPRYRRYAGRARSSPPPGTVHAPGTSDDPPSQEAPSDDDDADVSEQFRR